MRSINLFALILAMLSATSAVAQSPVPDGWVLEEDAASGSIYLVHYDAESNDVDMQLSCYRGFGDVVFSVYSHLTGMPDGAAFNLLLGHEGTTFPIDAVGNNFDGHYVVEGIVTFEPPLTDLLLSRFSVSLDGKEIGHFTAKSDRAGVEKAIEACQDRP